MKKNMKKLSLRKETLLSLDGLAVLKVQGGASLVESNCSECEFCTAGPQTTANCTGGGTARCN